MLFTIYQHWEAHTHTNRRIYFFSLKKSLLLEFLILQSAHTTLQTKRKKKNKFMQIFIIYFKEAAKWTQRHTINWCYIFFSSSSFYSIFSFFMRRSGNILPHLHLHEPANEYLIKRCSHENWMIIIACI